MARQMITCESCGKRYDYLKTEACPNCGAFNYVKNGQQHLCGAEDVERILEMRTVEHDDEDEPRRADTRIDRGLMRKFARARQQLDRLETTEDVFRTSFGSDRTARDRSSVFRSSRSDRRSDREDRRETVNQSGCLKAIVIFVVVVVLLNLFGSLLFAGISALVSDPETSPPYSAEPEPDYYSSETYMGMPGATYTFHDLTFTVLDAAILDTGDTLDNGQVLMGVNLEAFCDLPEDEYTPVRAYPYLSDEDYTRYYEIWDVVSPEDEDLVNRVVGNNSFYLVQDFELSYMDGGENVTGYMPFLVDAGTEDELQLNLQLDCYNTDTGEYESICYVFDLENPGKLSLEDAASAYYNSSYY